MRRQVIALHRRLERTVSTLESEVERADNLSPVCSVFWQDHLNNWRFLDRFAFTYSYRGTSMDQPQPIRAGVSSPEIRNVRRVWTARKTG